MRSESLHRFRVNAVILILLLAGGDPAGAVLEQFSIDPVQSSVALGSASQVSLVFGFGGLIDRVDAPIESQLAIGGAGATLPDGTTGDGLRTNVEGTLLVDLTPMTIGVLARRTRIHLGGSGSWFPGPPSAPAANAPGELAVHFPMPAGPFDLSGRAALRGVEINLAFLANLTPAGEGRFTFPAGILQPTLQATVVDGVLDYATGLAGISGRVPLVLGTTLINNGVNQGTLEVQDNGGKRITVPIGTQISVGSDDFGLGVPLSVILPMSGQIVAVNEAFVPEPGVHLLQASVLLGLCGLAATRRRRGRPR